MKSVTFSDDDWKSLLPGKPFKLGHKAIDLYPLGAGTLAEITRSIWTIQEDIAEAGVNKENIGDPESILKITSIILEKAPDILEKATGIATADVKRLPLDLCVDLVTAVLDVNIESRESLEKNFITLAQKVQRAMGAQPSER